MANRLLRPLAARLLPLDEERLIARARRATGLESFGEERFRAPLRVLLAALDTEAALSPLGRFLARQTILQLLSTRLRVEDAIRRHPEIRAEPVTAPIVIL